MSKTVIALPSNSVITLIPALGSQNIVGAWFWLHGTRLTCVAPGALKRLERERNWATVS